jgi:hypothetical protein
MTGHILIGTLCEMGGSLLPSGQPANMPPAPMHKYKQPQQQQQDKERHDACQQQALRARFSFGLHAVV